MKKGITNREVIAYVADRLPFETKNKTMYGQWQRRFKAQPLEPEYASEMFVVYSYGPHFPMYAYDKALGVWVGNKDRFSNTTSRHQSHAHPGTVNHWLSTDSMRELTNIGSLTNYLTKILQGQTYAQ